MVQQSAFPIRYGLSVPRGENLQGTQIVCEGGLDLTQSVIEQSPGFASELINFEVALAGGYKRIDGFAKYSSTIVPGFGEIIGTAVFYPSQILAARRTAADHTKYDIYQGGGTTWTKINGATTLSYSSSMVVNFSQHNWTGTPVVIITDGVNPAMKWDGTTFTVLNGSGSAANPLWAKEFAGYLFVGGYSSNYGAIKVSAPLNEADWLTVDGAAEIVVGDTVAGFGVWRQQLIIFSRKSIHKIVGNSTDPTSSAPFTISSITNKVGCVEGRTIQEIDGDLVYLAQDGIRTISGTFNIGDTEIASISRQIQPIVSLINPITQPCNTLVIGRKTQYRLFYTDPATQESECKGIIGGIRLFKDGHQGWEWGKLKGIKPYCCAAGYLSDGKEYIMHGGYDGYVYRQEEGSTFSGQAVNELYTTVPLEFGDRGLRKVLHRVTTYSTVDNDTTDLSLRITYDQNKLGVINPTGYTLANVGSTIYLYDDGNLYDDVAVYDIFGNPIIRTSVQGSGFIAQLGISANTALGPPYTIQGFYVEYFPAARR